MNAKDEMWFHDNSLSADWGFIRCVDSKALVCVVRPPAGTDEAECRRTNTDPTTALCRDIISAHNMDVLAMRLEAGEQQPAGTPKEPGFYFFRRKPPRCRNWHMWGMAEVHRMRSGKLKAFTLEYSSGFHLIDPTMGKVEWSERIPDGGRFENVF